MHSRRRIQLRRDPNVKAAKQPALTPPSPPRPPRPPWNNAPGRAEETEYKRDEQNAGATRMLHRPSLRIRATCEPASRKEPRDKMWEQRVLCSSARARANSRARCVQRRSARMARLSYKQCRKLDYFYIGLGRLGNFRKSRPD